MRVQRDRFGHDMRIIEPAGSGVFEDHRDLREEVVGASDDLGLPAHDFPVDVDVHGFVADTDHDGTSHGCQAPDRLLGRHGKAG